MKPLVRSLRPRSHAWLLVWLLSLVGVAFLVSCGSGGGVSVTDTSAATAGTSTASGAWRWDLPTYFPVPKVPADNAMSNEKVDLGRYLFHDKRLSGNGTQACGSCHLQSLAFTDGLAQAIGSTGSQHPRGAQHLANVAYSPTLTWASTSLTSLEQQMQVPLFGSNPVEMGVNDGNRDTVLQRIQALTLYQEKFRSAFPGEASPVSWNNITKAIASFERALVSANSRYDQYLKGQTSLNAAQTRGMNLFFGEKAECFHCHGSFNFNDQTVHVNTRILEIPFSNTGLYNIGGTGAFPVPNRGLFELTGQASDMGLFRAPSLRNVEKTAPYMHDGSITTLEAVLDFYAAGGRNIDSGPFAGDGRQNPNKSSLIALINLSAQEKADIVAFLKTLTDDEFLTTPKFSDPFK